MHRPERSDKKPLILYHADCSDGFCAAWVAWRIYKDVAEYYPASYGTEPPWELIDGNDVIILDFCYSYEAMKQISARAWRLVVLDHHKTAAEDMKRLVQEGYPEHILFTFDMERSGAGLARDFYYRNELLYINQDTRGMVDSWLVDYTQDRDLWRFALPHSKQISTYIGTLPFDFEAYENVHTNVTVEEAMVLGTGAQRYLQMFAEKTAKQAFTVDFMGYANIPLVNVTRIGVSEVVGLLAERPNTPFAVGWSQRGDGKIEVSLRSRGNFDVSALAKLMRGGGHVNAAGFVVDTKVHHWFPFVRG
jgi:uncharacterized protein